MLSPFGPITEQHSHHAKILLSIKRIPTSQCIQNCVLIEHKVYFDRSSNLLRSCCAVVVCTCVYVCLCICAAAWWFSSLSAWSPKLKSPLMFGQKAKPFLPYLTRLISNSAFHLPHVQDIHSCDIFVVVNLASELLPSLLWTRRGWVLWQREPSPRTWPWTKRTTL